MRDIARTYNVSHSTISRLGALRLGALRTPVVRIFNRARGQSEPSDITRRGRFPRLRFPTLAADPARSMASRPAALAPQCSGGRG